MTAKVVLHLPDNERAWLDAGNMSRLYPRIQQLIEARGGEVELAPRFPPGKPDGNLHIVDNARQAHVDVLIGAVAYLEGCWHLDPKGVLADSMIADLAFDPTLVDQGLATSYVEDLKTRFSDARFSRYHQRKNVEDIQPDSIVIFLQGPPPYNRNQAFMSCEDMIRTVLDHAAQRPVYMKPHPNRKEEGLDLIRQMKAEGYAPIKTNANVHDLLRQAAVTVSVNSAASIEGLLHGRPALLFARSDFAAAAQSVRSYEEFPAALERALTRSRDYTKFLYWYFTQCLWLDDPDFEEHVLTRFSAMGFDRARLGLL
jgi:hypothetical protein